MKLTKFERRWARAEFGTIFPGEPRDNAKGTDTSMESIEQMEIDGFLTEVCERVPFKAALGLRVAIWIAALAPIFLLGRLATILSISRTDREAVINRLLASPSYAIRQLVMILKTIGALLYGAHPSVRARMMVKTAAPISGERLIALRMNRSAAA